MLVLTRKAGEKIILEYNGNRKIEVLVGSIKNGSVRIAIGADKDVDIYREELGTKKNG